MEFYLFHHSEFEKLYNCSIYNLEDIPLQDRQHIILGCTFLALFVVFECLYIPCLFAIWKHLRNPCYKLMFFIGLIDVVIMLVPGLLTGIYSIQGTMYCSNPLFQYFSGCAGTFLWALESSTAIVLAINRCLEIYSPQLGKKMFEGKRVYMWMLSCVIYSFFYSSLSHPITFNGIYVSWFFNPHLGIIDDSLERKFGNYLHVFHNMSVCLSLTGLYILFTIMISLKMSLIEGVKKLTRSQKMTFIQVFIISFVNATGSVIHIYDQWAVINTKIDRFFIIIGAYLWILAHGMPALMFMTMNKTIRNECMSMLGNNIKVGTTSSGFRQKSSVALHAI